MNCACFDVRLIGAGRRLKRAYNARRSDYSGARVCPVTRRIGWGAVLSASLTPLVSRASSVCLHGRLESFAAHSRLCMNTNHFRLLLQIVVQIQTVRIAQAID